MRNIMKLRGQRISAAVFAFPLISNLAAERLIHQRVDGLGDADDAEQDADASQLERIKHCL